MRRSNIEYFAKTDTLGEVPTSLLTLLRCERQTFDEVGEEEYCGINDLESPVIGIYSTWTIEGAFNPIADEVYDIVWNYMADLVSDIEDGDYIQSVLDSEVGDFISSLNDTTLTRVHDSDPRYQYDVKNNKFIR